MMIYPAHLLAALRRAGRASLALAAVAILTLPATATAGGTAFDAYGGDGRGTLPLSGLDVAVLGFGAALLIAAGVALRVLARGHGPNGDAH